MHKCAKIMQISCKDSVSNRLKEFVLCVQKALDEKLAAIEQNKVDLIAVVKQTSAKLKFTLNGSVARDVDHLTAALQSSHERLTSLNSAVDDAIRVLSASTSECPQINVCLLCSVL